MENEPESIGELAKRVLARYEVGCALPARRSGRQNSDKPERGGMVGNPSTIAREADIVTVSNDSQLVFAFSGEPLGQQLAGKS